MPIDKLSPEVKSEVGQLEVVLLHRPGRELENMTPENVERALYSDILNLSVAAREYHQFEQVLRESSQVLEVSDLLASVLNNQSVKESLVAKICRNENHSGIIEELALLNGQEIARLLVEGVELKKDNLTRYFSKETYSLVPLHNFFYTRDASVVINQRVLIARMASKVRERESIIMECIFENHPMFDAETVNPASYLDLDSTLSIEGGDVLVAREDVLLVGLGARSTTRGVDFILERFKQRNESRTIIVQELPRTPESFIHLDMVFTFLDTNICMVYEPLILRPNRLPDREYTDKQRGSRSNSTRE
jgi:arginine deiminase